MDECAIGLIEYFEPKITHRTQTKQFELSIEQSQVFKMVKGGDNQFRNEEFAAAMDKMGDGEQGCCRCLCAN